MSRLFFLLDTFYKHLKFVFWVGIMDVPIDHTHLPGHVLMYKPWYNDFSVPRVHYMYLWDSGLFLLETHAYGVQGMCSEF